MIFKVQLLVLFASANLLLVPFSSKQFYEALYSDSLTTVEATLTRLEKEKTNTTNKAYRGGLLMKKSGFLKKAAEKIAVFKEGHELLEAAIKKYPQNAEYRFIRLTIQEHAPKILKYNKNITEDKALIIKEYSELQSTKKSYILDYAKQSEVLTTADLK